MQPKYRILISNGAKKSYKKLKNSLHFEKCQEMLKEMQYNPFSPPYKKLNGKIYGIHLDCYAKKINIMHRLVYKVDERNKIIHVLSFWSHYE